jgi:hypothetical protein
VVGCRLDFRRGITSEVSAPRIMWEALSKRRWAVLYSGYRPSETASHIQKSQSFPSPALGKLLAQIMRQFIRSHPALCTSKKAT